MKLTRYCETNVEHASLHASQHKATTTELRDKSESFCQDWRAVAVCLAVVWFVVSVWKHKDMKHGVGPRAPGPGRRALVTDTSHMKESELQPAPRGPRTWIWSAFYLFTNIRASFMKNTKICFFSQNQLLALVSLTWRIKRQNFAFTMILTWNPDWGRWSFHKWGPWGSYGSPFETRKRQNENTREGKWRLGLVFLMISKSGDVRHEITSKSELWRSRSTYDEVVPRFVFLSFLGRNELP